MSNSDRKRSLDTDVIQRLCSETSTVDPIREAFLKRLQTFDVFNWSGKPIDPPQCAKYGWEIAEKDVLKCSACRNYLSVELPPLSERENYNQACKQLKSRLVSKHSKFCLYVINPIPDRVYEISHPTKTELFTCIVKESSSFDQLSVNFKFTELKEVEEVFDWLVEKSKFTTADKTSYIFALTGWTYVKENQLARCDYCNRKWLLEKFTRGDEIDGEECSFVDPLSQHQCWCAWRNLEKGWHVQLEQLQLMRNSFNSPKKTRLDTSSYASLIDGMRNVRQLLNGKN